jgi:hypothetical protein
MRSTWAEPADVKLLAAISRRFCATPCIQLTGVVDRPNSSAKSEYRLKASR